MSFLPVTIIASLFVTTSISRADTKASTLLDRAQTYIRAKRTEIVFLDEFHHLVHSDNKSVAASVHDDSSATFQGTRGEAAHSCLDMPPLKGTAKPINGGPTETILRGGVHAALNLFCRSPQ